MICRNCGKDNKDSTSVFCNGCGEKIILPSSEKKSMPVKRPDPTPQIILAVINIAVCGSMILGIIALVFSIMASGEKNWEEAERKIKTALILNVIGLSMAAMMILAVIFLFVFYFFLYFLLIGFSILLI